MIPGLTTSSASIPLVAPGTEFTPRTNQLDLGVSKLFRYGHSSLNAKLDLFNALNADYYTSDASTQFNATTYQQPSVILQGRVVRIGMDVKW